MKTQIQTNVARLARVVVISGAAALATTILAPNTDATMLPWAVGNDGSGIFDGSITVKSASEFAPARATEEAINGSGLSGGGLHNVLNADDHWLGSFNPNWVIVDLGQSYWLQELRFWNFKNDAVNRGVATANIWYHNGPTEPNASNTDLNGLAFNSTGWTLWTNAYAFTQLAFDPSQTPFPASDIIDFGPSSLQARFFALGNMVAQNPNSGFIGISEMQFIIPEPSIFALFALGGLLLVRMRRRQ